LFVSALALSISSAEVAARFIGYHPTPRRLYAANWIAFDPGLGSTNRPDTRVRWGQGIASFLPDASRRTADPTVTASTHWLLIGCSYTQGFGLADPDTFGWKLQARFPTVTLTNFGTGAYGTYQSLLRFRMERPRLRPSLVIYGFGDFQGARDATSRDFMHSTGEELPFLPPHVGLLDGQLIEYPLRWLPSFPLERRSALAHLAASAYLDRYAYTPVDAHVIEIHRAVLRRLRDEVEASGAHFIVANLWAMPTSRDDWRAFFARERFHVAECVTPDTPFDHPDAAVSTHHAACIAKAIEDAGL
jgi:hypothetical protein